MSTSISASISASITTKGVHSCDKHNLRHHAQVQCFHNSDGYCMIGDRSTTKSCACPWAYFTWVPPCEISISASKRKCFCVLIPVHVSPCCTLAFSCHRTESLLNLKLLLLLTEYLIIHFIHELKNAFCFLLEDKKALLAS